MDKMSSLGIPTLQLAGCFHFSNADGIETKSVSVFILFGVYIVYIAHGICWDNIMQLLRKLHPNFIALNVSSYLYISVDRPVLEYHCVVLTPQLQYPCITIKQISVNMET